MRTIVHHREPRFTLVIRRTDWGGRHQVTATVYLAEWGLFYRATRATAPAAYRAADHAIRTYTAQFDFAKYTAMRRRECLTRSNHSG